MSACNRFFCGKSVDKKQTEKYHKAYQALKGNCEQYSTDIEYLKSISGGVEEFSANSREHSESKESKLQRKTSLEHRSPPKVTTSETAVDKPNVQGSDHSIGRNIL